jgi:activator-of-BECN1-regulated-autophagy protein 1
MLEMTESWIEGSKNTSAPESVSCSVSRYESSPPRRLGKRNIYHLLAQREISPRTKHQAKNIWSGSPECATGSIELAFWVTDARHDLFSWAESQSLHRWSARYCLLLPAPRSTIAAAFSPDGRTLASTQ